MVCAVRCGRGGRVGAGSGTALGEIGTAGVSSLIELLYIAVACGCWEKLHGVVGLTRERQAACKRWTYKLEQEQESSTMPGNWTHDSPSISSVVGACVNSR